MMKTRDRRTAVGDERVDETEEGTQSGGMAGTFATSFDAASENVGADGVEDDGSPDSNAPPRVTPPNAPPPRGGDASFESEDFPDSPETDAATNAETVRETRACCWARSERMDSGLPGRESTRRCECRLRRPRRCRQRRLRQLQRRPPPPKRSFWRRERTGRHPRPKRKIETGSWDDGENGGCDLA